MNDPIPPRRTQIERRAETRARLVDAAIQLWAHRGIEAVSLDEIAAVADRTRGAFHANFADRSELIAQVLDTVVADASEAISMAVQMASDPLGELAAYIEANVRYIADKPAHARALAAIVQHEQWTRKGRYADRAHAGSAELAEMLRRGIDMGIMRELDIALTALVIRGALDLQITLGRVVDHDSAQAIAEELSTLFTTGVRSPESRR